MAQTDRERIVNHLARYCFVVDRGTADEIAALFWDDARLDFNGIYNGYAEIRQCYAEWIARARDPVEGLRHLIHVPYIELDGDAARAVTYVDADCHVRRSGRTILLRATYRDRLSRRAGEWRFAERHIVAMRRLYDTEGAR